MASGIWGAVLGGMLGTWIGCRRAKLPFWAVADCIAPGLILAQALGRWGNYFNQELYGGPSDHAVGGQDRQSERSLQRPDGHTFVTRRSSTSRSGTCSCSGILWRFIRRFWNRVPAGTVFALYATLYSFGRI